MNASVISAGLCLCAVLATGCAADGRASDGYVVRDSAGITIIENDHTRPAWGDAPRRLSAEPVLQIGALGGDGPDQLYRVIDSHRFADGRIAIVNSGTADVRFFDAAGSHIRTLGRRGDGPGEFRSPWAVFPLGDSVMVLDLYRAMSVFDSSGTYVRRFVPGEIQGERQGAPVGQFADGTVLLMRSGNDEGRTGLGRTMNRLVRIGPDGGVVTDFGDFEDQMVMFGGGRQYILGPWAHKAAADSTLWYGPGDAFEIREIAPDRTVLRLVRLDLPAVPVTAALVEEYRRSMLDRVRGTPQEPAFQRMFADVQHPDVLPAHFRIMVDEAANLWVQDYQPWGVPTGDRSWYVFDPDGRYLGSMVVPAQFTIHRIGQDYMLGRWTDELELEYVRVYRIE